MAHKSFQRKDRFYLKAKSEGYPARSAYKITELDDRLKIFKPGRRIVDLGCAPGGWLKVAEERLQGKGALVGIDLLPLHYTPKSGVLFIQGDFLEKENQEKIRDFLKGPADWILSDMSPNISGIKFRDEFQSYELCQQAFEFAKSILKKNGGLIFKVFPGPELVDLRRSLKTAFETVRTVVPEATRQSSTEIYIVCEKFRG